VETLYLNELHWRGRVDEHVFVVWAALAAEGAFPRLRRIDVTEGCLTNAPVLRTAFHDLCRCVCVTSLILRINIASAEHFLGERDRAGLGYLQELHLICELSGSTSYLFQLNEKVLLDDVAGWLVQASAIHTLMLRGSVRCADLARLPCASTLRTLYISCCPGPGFTEDIATRVAFPRLQDLDIVAYDANFQLTHILLESCTSLETISIRHYSAHGKLLPTVANTDVHALFAHIGAQPALRTSVRPTGATEHRHSHRHARPVPQRPTISVRVRAQDNFASPGHGIVYSHICLTMTNMIKLIPHKRDYGGGQEH
jgi:hypothetical protein